jgi:polysaccharide pyruvyl transferase WcaK-like protein
MTRHAPRVGLFGLLGSGNIGNDASTDAIVRYLRTEQPGSVVDAMCMGWERLRDRYGMATTPIQWQAARPLPGGPLGAALKMLGKTLDIVRTARWVSRHDVVIVPGMGIMDAALPINPWGVPWALFLLCLVGRLLGTKVALVSAGASPASNPLTARLYTWSGRLAYYRSFRDEKSRAVMKHQGLDTSGDRIYPDLVFTLPVDPVPPPDPLAVGVGVMAYYGGNEDRDQAAQIHAVYQAKMESFVGWLIDSGRSVRLFIGDEVDQPVADAIAAGVQASRPALDPARLTATPMTTYAELADVVTPVATVVATRFHNVLFALKLGKPVISIGYSPKNDSLMSDIGLGEYTQYVKSLDVEKLKAQFTQVESQEAQVRELLANVMPQRSEQAREQLDELSRALF